MGNLGEGICKNCKRISSVNRRQCYDNVDVKHGSKVYKGRRKIKEKPNIFRFSVPLTGKVVRKIRQFLYEDL